MFTNHTTGPRKKMDYKQIEKRLKEHSLSGLTDEQILENYNENKKLEIPMYDPHTGEPNPYYEELTGKPNPLLTQYLESSFIQPNSYPRDSKKNILPRMPIVYEPKRNNRWILTLPEETGIQSWVVSKTSRPSFRVVEKKFLGITFCKKIVWDSISIEFLDPIGPSTTHLIMNNINPLKRFDYTLEMLDPTGITVEKWEIKKCLVKTIDFCELNYGNDGLAKIKMVIQPKLININN